MSAANSKTNLPPILYLQYIIFAVVNLLQNSLPSHPSRLHQTRRTKPEEVSRVKFTRSYQEAMSSVSVWNETCRRTIYIQRTYESGCVRRGELRGTQYQTRPTNITDTLRHTLVVQKKHHDNKYEEYATESRHLTHTSIRRATIEPSH